VKEKHGVPVLTDVHEVEQVEEVAKVVDVLQVPAFLARQTDLLLACGKTGRAVNIKKGQFMSPQEMGNAVEKVREGQKGSGFEAAGSGSIMLTERGTFFGYNRLVNDFTALSVMKSFGVPVIFDATHSTQQPGGLGNASGGNPQYTPLLARAAVAAGVDGLFIECHPEPSKAKSDAASMVRLDSMEHLLRQCKEIAELRKGWGDEKHS
jgi:2-dehydro-3-deoxyphosphooctonate aldolase (KDO 8-P synthase)